MCGVILCLSPLEFPETLKRRSKLLPSFVSKYEATQIDIINYPSLHVSCRRRQRTDDHLARDYLPGGKCREDGSQELEAQCHVFVNPTALTLVSRELLRISSLGNHGRFRGEELSRAV